jgi:UDP-N-acetyl-D-mannosaminuronic acid transferase (WecB/TagA/CpsF family)
MQTESSTKSFRQILGVTFFHGSAAEAVELLRKGGLLVAPSAPALKDLPVNAAYREACLNADLVITDSALMVMLWNILQRDSVRRLSGLEYLRHLLTDKEVRTKGNTFWVMAGDENAERNIRWLKLQGLEVAAEDYYVAPRYGDRVEDPELVRILDGRQPRHVVLTVGGGIQEPLGYYLKCNVKRPAAIHCIGAAIAFLSGDQVHIPHWADRLYLGWLFRCFSNPKRYGKRYWDARHLMPLVIEYRERLPEIRALAAR